MRIHALLSFYDESPTWLASCVAGIGRFCDILVAVDGAYALYPGGLPRSHPQQIEAITQTAESAGLGLLLYQPQEVWHGNEVEKRNHCLALAGTIASADDWVAVIDADYHVFHCKPERIRAELEATEHEVATYALLDGQDFQATPILEEYAAKNYVDSRWSIFTRDLYRWNPKLRVGRRHSYYSIADHRGFRWLRHGSEGEVDCLDLRENLVFYHRTQDRSKKRRAEAQAYYQNRAEAQIEEVVV